MKLDVQFAAAEVGPLNIAGLGSGIGLGVGDGIGNGRGTGFGLATISELDQIPTVVSAPVFPFPDEARARGVGIPIPNVFFKPLRREQDRPIYDETADAIRGVLDARQRVSFDRWEAAAPESPFQYRGQLVPR